MKWFNTEAVTPLPNREVLARNTNKEFPAERAAKQNHTLKFNGRFTQDDIKENMLERELNEWCYL